MKTRQTINAIVAEIVVREYHEVLPSSSFANDFKSHKEEVIEVVMKVEETFGIVFSDNETDAIETVQDLYNGVDKKLGELAEKKDLERHVAGEFPRKKS